MSTFIDPADEEKSVTSALLALFLSIADDDDDEEEVDDFFRTQACPFVWTAAQPAPQRTDNSKDGCSQKRSCTDSF